MKDFIFQTVEKIQKTIKNKRFWYHLGMFTLGILLFVFLIDWIVMPLYTKQGKNYELPDVTDASLQDALKILEDAGFNPIVQDSIYDEHFVPGNIVQQNPFAFSRVKKGRRVYLIVSRGERPRFVPKLVGETLQEAKFRLKEVELELNDISIEYTEEYHKGVVMRQSLPEGMELEKDQKINITVSDGPAPSSLEIPNLVGKSLESAQNALEVVNVKIGSVKSVYRPNLVPGTVLMQSISAGQKAMLVDSVNLIISTDQPIGNN